MKKRAIQVLSALLTVCLLLTAAPPAGFAEIKWPEFSFAKLLNVFSRAATIVNSGTCGENLTWTLDDSGTLTISGSGGMTDYSVFWNSYAPWYDSWDSVNTVVIQSGVTSIGDWAFYGCYDLTSVTIPDSVTSIGVYAFYYCGGLTSVTIPDGVTSIEDYAFCGCSGLTSVTIPELVTSIEGSAFENCRSLVSITIPSSVTSISLYAFSGCSKLESIIVASGNLTYYSMNNCLIETDTKTLILGCKNSVIPVDGRVIKIGSGAFDGCMGLTSVTIPACVTSIEIGAFRVCTSLSSVTIPDSVINIGNGAFYNCTDLKNIYYSGTEEQWNAITILEGNDSLMNATIHYNSTGSGDEPGGGSISGIASLYPENGCKDFDYKSGAVLLITFEEPITRLEPDSAYDTSAKLNFSAGKIRIYSASDDALLWEAHENVYRPGYCSDISVSASDPNTLDVRPSTMDFSFDSMTDYYVTMDPGFVCFDSGNTSPGISKGQWKFQTKTNAGAQNLNENIEFFVSEDGKSVRGEVDIQYKSDWFRNNNIEYQHGLARFCSDICMLGYSNENQLKTALKTMGFSGKTECNLDTGRDEVNYFITSRDISIDGSDYKLVFAGLIGSHALQWNSDFDPFGLDREKAYANQIDYPNTHLGFADACEYVRQKLDTYMDQFNHLDKGKIKMLITGHSRGAAAANLMAAKIIDTGAFVKPENLYTYTFATPRVVEDKNGNTKNIKYLSIFNIVNPEDFVTKVMLASWNYERYGQTLSFPSKTNANVSKEYNKDIQSYYTQFKNGDKYKNYLLGEQDVYAIIQDMSYHVDSVSDFYSEPFFFSVLRPGINVYDYFNTFIIPAVNGVGLSDSKYIDLIVNAGIPDFTELLHNISAFFVVAQGIGQFTKHLFLDTYFGDAHEMQTYCAFMHALPASEIKYRAGYHGTVNCPVDVEIYETDTNELVGRIVNNTVDETVAAKENAVVMSVDGDSKSFWLPEDGDYKVVLTGNDNGTMDYSICEIDSDSTQTVAKSNFFDQEVKKDAELEMDIAAEAELPDLRLKKENGEWIEPTETFTENEVTTYSVTVNIEGNGYTDGSLTAESGEYITLSASADENSVFTGWYRNGKLVSTEASYGFVVKENVELTAKFEEKVELTDLIVQIPEIDLAGAGYSNADLSFIPENAANQTVNYASSDEAVAVVSESGTVRGVGVGTAEITVTAADGKIRKTVAISVICSHRWNAGIVTRPATVTEAGEKTYTCAVCGETKTEPIAKLPDTTPQYTPGDVNHDGKVTAADARLALRRAVGLESYAEGSAPFLACDIDKNGKITAADARKILRAAVGLEKLN